MGTLSRLVGHSAEHANDSATRVRRLAALVARIRFALAVRRERNALQNADDAMLADLGLSRADVHREASRGFLDVSEQMVDRRSNGARRR